MNTEEKVVQALKLRKDGDLKFNIGDFRFCVWFIYVTMW